VLKAWAQANPRTSHHGLTQANGYQAGKKYAHPCCIRSFIAFLDSDDYWYPSKTAELRRSAYSEPGVGVLSHDVVMIQDGQVTRRIKAGPRSGYREMLLWGNCISPSATSSRERKSARFGGF